MHICIQSIKLMNSENRPVNESLNQTSIKKQKDISDDKIDQINKLRKRQIKMKRQNIQFYSPFDEQQECQQQAQFSQFLPQKTLKYSHKNICNLSDRDIIFDQASLQNLSEIDIQMLQFTQNQGKIVSYSQISSNLQRQIMKTNRAEKRLTCQKYKGSFFDQQWVKRQEKTVVAIAFINRGYGVFFLKEELKNGNYQGVNIDQSKYKSYSGSMARESFRKLQSFLLRDCGRKMSTFSSYQMKLLQTLLLNCRLTLSSRISKLFLEVVRITYCLDDVYITQQQALDLYKGIYQAMKQKISGLKGSVQGDSSDDFDSYRKRNQNNFNPYRANKINIESGVLPPDIERDIVKEYIHQMSLSKIRDVLKAKLQLDERHINIKVIRNTMRRILRATIRLIQNIMTKNNPDHHNFYPKLTDDKIKYLIQAAETHNLRSQLCRIYLLPSKDHKSMEQASRILYSSLQRRYPSRRTYQYNFSRCIDLDIRKSQ